MSKNVSRELTKNYLEETANNEMRAWSGQDPEIEEPKGNGFLTSTIGLSIITMAVLQEPSKFFFKK